MANSTPLRLLSSVAVVGRDNEPIYLRGDLCDVVKEAEVTENKGEEFDADESVGSAGDGNEKEGGETTKNTGLLERFTGIRSSKDSSQLEDATDPESEDDPFGFFTDSKLSSDSSAPMSLTQQLVLHASLDRFEEMAARSNTGAPVRWRMPGSSGANAMWMGLLCEVEERWNVYGYLTNTGIKFMIIVENVQPNEEGIRHDSTPSSFVNLPSSNNRESELKNIFSHLHELYVRYTMNPFSKLRSPIKSRAFDKSILDMAQSFNGSAMKRALLEKGEGKVSWI